VIPGSGGALVHAVVIKIVDALSWVRRGGSGQVSCVSWCEVACRIGGMS
jgi:hypothetical protein